MRPLHGRVSGRIVVEFPDGLGLGANVWAEHVTPDQVAEAGRLLTEAAGQVRARQAGGRAGLVLPGGAQLPPAPARKV